MLAALALLASLVTLPAPSQGVTYVSLSWTAPASSPDPVASYGIFRSPSGESSYTQINSAAVTATNYQDTQLAAGTCGDYEVLSIDASGVTSGPSNVATGCAPTSVQLPTAPTNLIFGGTQ